MSERTIAPTLQDVAAAAGVSTATVSRCLNAPDKVVESTQKRVMEAVRSLGYAPNFGARAMASRRTKTIGAIVPTLENAIFAKGLQKFQEELKHFGYQLLVASSSYQFDEEEAQVRALVARGADGILLIGHDRAPETVAFIKKRGLPALIAWSHAAEGDFPSVGFDNRSAMRKMVEEVLRQGHRRIAMISAYTAQNDRARARVAGARDALSAAGLNGDALPMIETVYSIAAGSQAFDTLMRAAEPPTAVICANDILAVGAVKRAKALGLSVPGQVSITGFDDVELAQVIDPELTTVRVPHRVMGKMAAQRLLGLLDGAEPVENLELRTFLQIRGTLGPAPEV